MTKFSVGDNVIVRSNRKGVYKATVTKNFDTEADEWYSVSLRQEYLSGLVNEWFLGDSVPCRRGIDSVELDMEVS